MLIKTSPIEDALSEIEQDVRRAADVIDPWTAPTGLPSGLESAARAVRALHEVHAAIADLEPGAAIIITEALERGLAGPR